MKKITNQLHQFFINQQLINNPKASPLDSLMLLSLTLSPLLYLTLRGWTNIYVFTLFILGVLYSSFSPQLLKNSIQGSNSKWIVFTLCSPILAIFISQSFRQDFSSTAYDGPSRFLLASLIFLYLKDRQINFTKILEWVLPISLMFCLAAYFLNPSASAAWGGRAASYFVDPITFGAYCAILGSLCLISVNINTAKDNKILLALKVIGFAAGIYLSIKSQSRSAWTAAIILIAFWSFLKISNRNKLISWALIATAITLGIATLQFFPEINSRIAIATQEVTSYFRNNNFDTSIGLRISMIRVAINLILENPLSGFQDGIIPQLNNIASIKPFYTDLLQFMVSHTGTHNEILAQGVRSGIWGLISSISLFIVPGLVFLKHIKHPNKRISSGAILGLSLVLGLFITSLTIQVFNLKYTSSFYALMIAALAAQTLQHDENL